MWGNLNCPMDTAAAQRDPARDADTAARIAAAASLFPKARQLCNPGPLMLSYA